MKNISLASQLLSGPSILAALGVILGGGALILSRTAAIVLPAPVLPLCLSLGASALICACLWVAIATVSSHRRRLTMQEAALKRLSLELAAFRHQSRDALPAADDQKNQVAAELRMLQQLLAQVLERRAKPLPRPTVDVPALRLVADDMPSPTPPMAQTDILSIMRSALEDSRIDLHLQPIVRLPNRRVQHYEAFSRVRDTDGTLLFPQDYLPPAEAAGLMGTLDNLLLFRCITLLRNLGPRKPGARIFVNLALASLLDKEFLADFVYFMSKHQELAARLIFEMSGKDSESLDSDTLSKLAELSKAGFGFCIDLGDTPDLNAAVAEALKIQFIKLRTDTLIAAQHSFDLDRLRVQLKTYRAALIATHVEDERAVVDVLDLGADFGQGYLFGKPRQAREDLTLAQAA